MFTNARLFTINKFTNASFDCNRKVLGSPSICWSIYESKIDSGYLLYLQMTQLSALIKEKQLARERLATEHDALLRVQTEQNDFIDQFALRK